MPPSPQPPAPAELRALVPRLAGLRVLVIGDVMLDIYDFCRSVESKPIDSEKPGKRAYAAHESVRRIGGAGNVATNLAALGARPALVGLVGQDGHRHTVAEMCEAANIRHSLVSDPARPTTTKTRIYIDNDYLLRKDHESAAAAEDAIAGLLAAAFRARLAEGAEAVVLSDYAKGVFTADLARAVLADCRAAALPVVVDFKPGNREFFAGADLLVPNESEADALLPGFKGCADLAAAVAALRESLRARRLVVTLGARGLCGIDREGFFHIPGLPVRAVDAVGCGDTVRAVLALALAAGCPLASAAALANHAAAVIVQKPATATLGPEELLAAIPFAQ
jgi:rfaE bifunctional protein kinase chain/domain